MKDRRHSRDTARRHILILPPHRLWAPWTDPPDPDEPDRAEVFRLLAARGYSYSRLDPCRWPWNPFARAHAALGAIDPLRALRVLLFHRHTQVVLCNFESSALIILLLRRLFLFRGKVVLYDVGVAGTWRLRDAILRLVLPRADMIMPLGHAQVAGLLALGARSATVRPIRQPTAPDFYPDTDDVPDGYVLAVGDDVSRDYPTLLRAVAGLTRKVVIRSRNLMEDRLALPGVTVLTEPLTTRLYRDLVAGAALVVIPLHPSIHAGGISTLLEAMASGKAVIVSDSPGLRDYLQDGTTCLVVPPGDPARLREAIDLLLTDAAVRRRLGAASRRFVVASCSPRAEAAQLAAAFDSLQAASERTR
nr:glycosyltransferase family 4 protein [uncultured Rhodopila sp.]